MGTLSCRSMSTLGQILATLNISSSVCVCVCCKGVAIKNSGQIPHQSQTQQSNAHPNTTINFIYLFIYYYLFHFSVAPVGGKLGEWTV